MSNERNKFIAKVILNKKNDVSDLNTIEYWIRRLYGIEPEFEGVKRKTLISDEEFRSWTNLLNRTFRIKVGVANLFGKVPKTRKPSFK